MAAPATSFATGLRAVCDSKTGDMDMTRIFKKLAKDKSGASAAEYALIVAVMGALIAAAVTTLGNAFTDAMNQTADKVNEAGDSSTTTGG